MWSNSNLWGLPSVVGFAIMAYACGTRHILRHALSDIGGRACYGVRRLVVSNISGSGALTVIQTCRGETGTKRGTRRVIICSRPSGKLCSTVGGNVSHTANSCLIFLGTKSIFPSSSALRCIRKYMNRNRGLPNILCKSASVIGSRKEFLHRHHLSPPGGLG